MIYVTSTSILGEQLGPEVLTAVGAACFLLASCLACSYTLTVEEICSPETLEDNTALHLRKSYS